MFSLAWICRPSQYFLLLTITMLLKDLGLWCKIIDIFILSKSLNANSQIFWYALFSVFLDVFFRRYLWCENSTSSIICHSKFSPLASWVESLFFVFSFLWSILLTSANKSYSPIEPLNVVTIFGRHECFFLIGSDFIIFLSDFPISAFSKWSRQSIASLDISNYGNSCFQFTPLANSLQFFDECLNYFSCDVFNLFSISSSVG